MTIHRDGSATVSGGVLMKKFITLLLSVLLVMTGFATRAAQNLEIATGEHRVDSNLEQRCAYLFGVGN